MAEDTQLAKFKEIVRSSDGYLLGYLGDEHDGYRVIHEDRRGKRRWSEYVDVYVEFPDGRIFVWTYDDASTEYQETEYPWDFGTDEKWNPEPYEVEKYTETVTVTKFRKKA